MKLVLAAALVSFTAVAAPLNGLYAVGDLGIVEFSTSGTSVVGKLRTNGRCMLPVNSVVAQGALEGSTFAGTVTVCQEGSTAARRACTRCWRWRTMNRLPASCASIAVARRPC